MTNTSMPAEERRDAWSSGFAHGDDPDYWDYIQGIAKMLEDLCERVEALVGPEQAAAPLRDLLVAAGAPSRSKTWRDAMEEDWFAVGSAWPNPQPIEDAGLYGIYGVTRPEIPMAERSTWLDALVEEVTKFAKPLEAQAVDNAIVRIARIARARRALDTGKGEVDVGSLAILGSVSEGRLRNLMSGPAPTLERGPDGGVLAVSALSWLQKRKEFLRSIWDQPEPDDEEEGAGGTDAMIESAQMVFVPVARDNTTFHPGLARNGQYQIGGKGEERHFTDFDEALAALNAMPVPRWRRPNEHGHWGIVSGVAWQRVERRVPVTT